MKTKVMLTAALALIVAGAADARQRASTSVPDFGPNVKIFDPSMSTAQIKAVVDSVANQQRSDEFGTQRYALLFMPGTYGGAVPLSFDVGYYTEVAGLGALPGHVTINGTVDVFNQCGSDGCVALKNFWREQHPERNGQKVDERVLVGVE